MSKPMGLRDLKVAPYPTGAAVDVGAAIEATVEDRVKTAELPGDDAIAALSSYIEAATVKLSAGGISMEAIQVIAGKTLVESGSTPTTVRTQTTTAGRLPYFRLFGKSLGEGDDDVHVQVFKVKLTKSPGVSMKNGEFHISECEGLALPNDSGDIYDVIENETAADLPAS